jgi:hypothetical protein
MSEKAKPKRGKRVSGTETVTGGRRGEAAARAKHGTQMGTKSQKRQPDAPGRKSPNIPKVSSKRTRGGGQGAGGK